MQADIFHRVSDAQYAGLDGDEHDEHNEQGIEERTVGPLLVQFTVDCESKERKSHGCCDDAGGLVTGRQKAEVFQDAFYGHGFNLLSVKFMAPEAGFEPAVGCPTSVFETDTFGLSVIPAYS